MNTFPFGQFSLIHNYSLSPSVAKSVIELNALGKTIDGTASISEQPLIHLNTPGYEHYLVFSDAQLIAYANVNHAINPENTNLSDTPHERVIVELIVHPQYRHQKIGSMLVETIFHDHPNVQFWAYGNSGNAQKLAHHYHLEVKRTLLLMSTMLMTPPQTTAVCASGEDPTRSGEDPTKSGEDPTRSGEDPHTSQLIRTYQPGDEEGILEVNNAAFSWHPEQSGWTKNDVLERLGSPWFDPLGLFIATNGDNSIMGFHWTKIHSDISAGEVYILAVHPGYSGKGIGKTLLEHGLEYFRHRQLSRSILYVEADNAPALKVYRQLGYTTDVTHCVYGK